MGEEIIKQSWAAILRNWWDELFHSSYTSHLHEEITYLRHELAQARIDRDKLQLMLNTVTPAGMMAHRASQPPQPRTPQTPGLKRWAEIEAERYALIEKNRLKKVAEAQATLTQAA